MRWFVWFVIGCAGTPPRTTAVTRVMVGGELATDRRSEPAPACTASRRIVVVDANGASIPDAHVIVQARLSEHAAEETLAIWRYSAAPVRTDAQGRAAICDPDHLIPEPRHGSLDIGAIEGIGGGSTYRDGQIVVTTETGASTTIAAPRAGVEVRVVVPAR